MSRHIEDDGLRPEYDFSGGVRGKHYRAYRRGTTITHSKHEEPDTRSAGAENHGARTAQAGRGSGRQSRNMKEHGIQHEKRGREGTMLKGTSAELEQELKVLEAHEHDATDGKWLEQVVRRVAPGIVGWRIEKVWTWREWPERKEHFPTSRGGDDGVDLVAKGDDGRWIAIQCKGRGEVNGKPRTLNKEDARDFIAASAADFWHERWIVTNAAVSEHVHQKMVTLAGEGKEIRHILIGEAIAAELARRAHEGKDARTEMQDEGVDKTLTTLRRLRARESKRHPGWNPGESRATVVMPCGTGKTRVGYEISRRMTGCRLTIVLAPSIGLVRQLRLAWLDWAKRAGETLNTLAVCSDKSAATRSELVAREEARAEMDDATRWHQAELEEELDLVAWNELTGDVEGKSAGIQAWLDRAEQAKGRHVVFCTYQSGHEVADALKSTGRKTDLLICDEAHRTSGIRKARRKRQQETIRRFTLCHDADRFPAQNRVYMTATPKVFDVGEGETLNLEVNSMDDEAIFGPWAFRLTYREAVEAGFLTDYRIVAVALPREGHTQASRQAEATRERVQEQGGEGTTRRFSASLALHKLAYGLALGGGIPDPSGEGTISIGSSIAFCNRISHSKDLAEELGSEEMQKKVATLLGRAEDPVRFKVEHRDAGSNAAERAQATQRLTQGTAEKPYALTNVGIFGEGIDTPTLDAVAFIEPKRSDTETIQAVGRPMRLSPKKEMGYVIVALNIPAGAHAEAWLESRENLEGWQELGAVLKALQKHDGRIEHKLGTMLHLVAPEEAEVSEHLVVAKEQAGSTTALLWMGPTGGVEEALASHTGSVEERLEKTGSVQKVDATTAVQEPPCAAYAVDGRRRSAMAIMAVDAPYSLEGDGPEAGYRLEAPAEKVAETLNDELRKTKGRVKLRIVRKRKKRAEHKTKRTQHALRLVHAVEAEGLQADAIRLNVLEKSGLMPGPERDVNVLRETVERAAAALRDDSLETALKEQLEMTRLKQEEGNSAADGCTVAGLMLTTAAIMHARLEEGTALAGKGVTKLADIARSEEPAETMLEAWIKVLDTDYQPVFGIARDILIRITRRERRTTGLDGAVRGIARDAVEIANSYAEMGMDHAGELFNKVMGNQAADGAYFTRPIPAMILAELAVEASGEADWLDPKTWRRLSAFDPTCGSGTLLVAYGQAIKRRVQAAGARPKTIQKLHKMLVEKLLMGMDINPVSLQLAGAQLTLGDTAVRYGRMNLWQMPYGYSNGHNHDKAAKAGTLELLTDERVVGTPQDPVQEDLLERTYQDHRRATRIALNKGEPCEQEGMVDDAVETVMGRRTALMNPPFVTRETLGSKFESDEQVGVRKRIDGGQRLLDLGNPKLSGICGRTTTRPLYMALGLLCIDQNNGVLGAVAPTISLTGPSGKRERKILANELDIRWVVTCHEPNNMNVSQSTAAESLIIGARRGQTSDSNGKTCFVSLTRLPRGQAEAMSTVEALAKGEIPADGYVREVSTKRMQTGDWSAAVWCNNAIDEAVEAMSEWQELIQIGDIEGVGLRAPGDGSYTNAPGEGARRKLVNVRGEGGQKTLKARADSSMRLKNRRGENEAERRRNEQKLWEKQQREYGAHLLLCTGQNLQSGNLLAVATEERLVGMRWKPVQGIEVEHAKAIAVWINSTMGRIQMMTVKGGDVIDYPEWQPMGLKEVRIPRPDEQGIKKLAAAFDATCTVEVPRYDKGYTEIRQQWDRAVCAAINSAELDEVGQWAEMLHREPVVSPKAFYEAHNL